MPKEVVYAVHTPYGEEHSSRTIIEVTWHRQPAGHVQLASLLVDGSTLSSLPLVNADEAKTPFDGGVFIDLGRDEINRLIRNLRRARDQAFGRDE